MDEKVDGEEKPIFEDIGLIKSLTARCSSSPNLETRQEAGLQLLQELMLENDEVMDDEERDDDDDKDDGEDIGEEDLGPDAYGKMQSGPGDGEKLTDGGGGAANDDDTP